MDCRFAIIILLFDHIFQVFSDKYQVVYRGPCLKKPNFYCHSKVENSYCSQQNNECFCLSDYVTVRERSGVKCKPLLSEMKCRIDSECSEITNSSICHPGAGSCTCPSGTMYIQHRNSCKNYLGNGTNDICYRCSKLGGICYSEELLISPFKQTTVNNTSCSCPFNTISPKHLTKSSKEFDKHKLCSALKVNLGEFCNDIDLICVSSHSKCKYSKEHFSTICQCENDHMAVFEKKVGHFNCYKVVFNGEYPQCTHCFTSGGKCILLAKSSTNVLLKCLCDKYQYFDIFSHSFECQKVTPSIKCQSSKIKLCLNIPIIYQYHQELLDRIRRAPDSIIISDAYSHGKNSTHQICKMNEYKISYEKNLAHLCSEFETNPKSLDYCGISNGNYLNTNFYGLYMRVWHEPFIIDLANDYLFDLTCKTTIEQEEFINGQIIDRSWTGTGKATLPYLFVFLDDTVELYISNSDSILRRPIRSLENIQINCKFFKRKDDYSFFNIEQCSEIVDNFPKIIYQRSLLNKKDPVHGIQFQPEIINRSENSREKEIKLVSSKFPAPNVSLLTKVVYSCIIKLCEDSIWCLESENQEAEDSNNFRKPMKRVNIRFLMKQIQIQVSSSKVDKKFVTFKSDNQECQVGSICLSHNQLIILSILTGIFFVLVLIVLTILIFKRSVSQLADPTNINQSHNMNVMDISLLPLMEICPNEKDHSSGHNSNEWSTVNPSGIAKFTTLSSNVFQNSLYHLTEIGQISVDESNIQLLPVRNQDKTTEINDNKYINAFHFQQSQSSSVENSAEMLINQFVSTKTHISPQTQSIAVVKLTDRVPLLYSTGEPCSSGSRSNPIQSTFTYNNNCRCVGLPLNTDV